MTVFPTQKLLLGIFFIMLTFFGALRICLIYVNFMAAVDCHKLGTKEIALTLQYIQSLGSLLLASCFVWVLLPWVNVKILQYNGSVFQVY